MAETVTNEELLRRIEELEAQVRTQNAFMSSLIKAQDWQSTMENIETVAKDVVKCDNATFYCYDSREEKFFTSTENGYRDWHTKDSSTEIIYAVKDNMQIYTENNMAYIPIANSGILTMEKDTGFTEDDFKYFLPGGGVVNTISLAVEKEFRHQNEVTDKLTQLKNRSGIEEYTEKTLCGNINANKSVFAIMCDIDHFKSVNDTYGHDAGDTVLKNVANIMQNGTRSGADCAFRFGGEEMVMILNCEPGQAFEVCERLRKEIEATKHTVMLEGKETEISVTVSMGLTRIAPGVEMTPDNANEVFETELKKADELLYKAKESGRNKIVASPEIYNEYISQKAVDVLEQKNNPEVTEEIKKCVKEDVDSLIDVLDDAEKNPEKTKAVSEIKKGILDADKFTHKHSEDNHFGTIPYNEINDKKFLIKVSENHIDNLKASLENNQIKYSGVKKDNGTYTITVDGWDNLKKARELYNGVKTQEITKSVSKSKSNVIGNKNYNDIDNKTYINGSTGVIKEMAKELKDKGIEFSGKYSGKHSTLTVDGKNEDVKNFIAECKKVEAWADKFSVKVAELKKEKSEIEVNPKGETI